jgi:predicted HAD superfamily phosphohydrolase YqeG
VTPGYQRLTGEAAVPGLLRQLSARTLIVDVEPLIAPWYGGQQALDQGLARFLGVVRPVETVAVVCFATNSARLPAALPEAPGIRVEYLASARKPLRTAPYLGLPAPGVVIGDQVATDGLLAKRIGYTFLHCRPRLGDMPPRPRLLAAGGEILRPFLFRGS